MGSWSNRANHFNHANNANLAQVGHPRLDPAQPNLTQAEFLDTARSQLSELASRFGQEGSFAHTPLASGGKADFVCPARRTPHRLCVW